MQKTQVILLDDIDGSPAETSVNFTLNGVVYQLDLNEEHYAQFLEEVGKWAKIGRRVSGRQTRGTGRAASGPSKSRLIREWAAKRGIELSPRGRIPVAIVEQYEAEQA